MYNCVFVFIRIQLQCPFCPAQWELCIGAVTVDLLLKGLFMNQLLEIQSKELIVFATAALPIIELRGAIPFGIALGLPPITSFFFSLLGSMVPVPFLIWLIRPIFELLRKRESFRKIVDFLCERSLAKSHSVQKYGFWGLVIFVAIPLPGTGVWSGALVAILLDMF